jgi:hypothetical protein
MGFTLVNGLGSGSVKDDAIATYSYSEDVTSLEPLNLTGGTSQVSVVAQAIDENTVGDKHPNSNLLVNNFMTLTDSEKGSVQLQVKSINNTDGMISITGSTIMARLNVEKTALPHGGTGYTLLSAIEYYCGLVDIVPVIGVALAAELEAIPVNFIGWTGNVWEHIKMLCAGFSASTTENVGLEAYVDNDTLVFRKAKTVAVDFSEVTSSQTVSVESFEAARSVEVFNYNTRYGVNEVVKEQNRSATSLYAANENVSITDSLQAEAGQTMSKRFKINATLESVAQPTCVSAILPLPYSGSTGQYVVVGSDDLPIDPVQWVEQGGNVTVSLTDVPDEIEISLVSPPAVYMLRADATVPEDVTYAPYKIGVETADGVDYPALYVVGTGVFFDKTSKVYGTGASTEYTSKDSTQSIDNPFITNAFNQSVRGMAAAQAACGPNVSISQTITSNASFGSTPGKIEVLKSNKFRITNASYGPGATSLTAVACASMADFENVWDTKTFANFTTVAFNGSVGAPLEDEALKFNEFTVIPLIGA